MIEFPGSPSDGDTHTHNGRKYLFRTGKGWGIAPMQTDAYAFMGAMVKKSADQTAANYTTIQTMVWQTEVYDYGAWFGSNTTDFVVPAGVTKVRVKFKVRVEALTANLWVNASIQKNGSSDYSGSSAQISSSASTVCDVECDTAVLEVTPGDVFTAHLQILTDTSVTINAARTSFSIEAVEQTARTLSVPQMLPFVVDGGGLELDGATIHGDMIAPYDMTIESVTLLADQSGSIVVDLWVDTYANYPPTVADTICASAKPTLSSALKYQDATLTGWTTFIPEGSIIRVYVETCTLIERCLVALKVRR